MTQLLRYVGYIALLLSLLSCTGAIEARQQPLLGGVDDDADPTAVLLLVHTADGGEGKCSGTVIGERTVLTAAHCVVPQQVGKDATFSLFLGPDVRLPEAQSPLLMREVQRVAFDPEFDLDVLHQGHDLAVVVAKEPLGITPVPLLRESLGMPVKEVRIIGYGIVATSDAEGTTAGRRRQVTAPVQGMLGPLLELGSQGVGPCAGDSGGSALWTGGPGQPELLLGLVSYVRRGCNGGSYVTVISQYLAEIDGWLSAWDHGESEPSSGCTMTSRPSAEVGPGLCSLLLTLFAWRAVRGLLPLQRASSQRTKNKHRQPPGMPTY